MAHYSAPIEDFLFLLHDVFAVEHRALPGFDTLTPDVTRAVLEGVAAFYEDVVFPLNATGDIEGAHLVDGKVITPAGFRRAYEQLVQSGWNRLAIPEDVGGFGFPPIISNMIAEIAASANSAFTMYSALAPVAVAVLSKFGPTWLGEAAVPHLVSGCWTSTMCLTEPNCGTDLRLMKSKAVAQADGSYRLSGTKMFISGGDHDMADNIVHLVLAKLPDESGRYPDRIDAVNLFAVPKLAFEAGTGKTTGPNGVSIGSIEHKMGLKANATCVLNFDDAIAWRLAPRDRSEGRASGMAGMFHVMNHARLGTGIAAVGYAVVPFQSAAAYARERRAGRAPGGGKDPGHTADLLADQPDVRRLLLESASFIEGARAAYLWASVLQSEADSDTDSERTAIARDLLQLFTPVFKAYFSDKGFEASNACLQVFGGHGYIRDQGIEQYVRDGRVLQIFEGANGVQAHDLVVRRLSADGGRAVRTFFDHMSAFVDGQREIAEMAPFSTGLEQALSHLEAALDWLNANGRANPATAAGVAYDILTLFGISAVAFIWARIARSALDNLESGEGNPAFLRRKLVLARIWMERQVPLAAGLSTRVAQGSEAILQFDTRAL